MDLEVKYARIVQWSCSRNSENEYTSEFIEAGYRPCLIRGPHAIDIDTKQIYQILRKNPGQKGLQLLELCYLEPDRMYADEVFTPHFNNQIKEMVNYRKRAEEINDWYNQQLKTKGKVFDFQKIRKRIRRDSPREPL